jgi:hypothetical protein
MLTAHDELLLIEFNKAETTPTQPSVWKHILYTGDWLGNDPAELYSGGNPFESRQGYHLSVRLRICCVV